MTPHDEAALVAELREHLRCALHPGELRTLLRLAEECLRQRPDKALTDERVAKMTDEELLGYGTVSWADLALSRMVELGREALRQRPVVEAARSLRAATQGGQAMAMRELFAKLDAAGAGGES